MDNNKLVLCTGGYDPVHGGHIDYLKEASLHGLLIVGLNSDNWLINKKSKAFMTFNERKKIIESFEFVHNVIDFDDSDTTAINAINRCLELYGNDIIFCNGGDRTFDNIPEEKHFKNNERVSFLYNVGGGKTNSSSILLGQWERNITTCNWGYYEILYEVPKTKVKELVVDPHCSLSTQRHLYRAEHWFITYGTATVKYQLTPTSKIKTKQYSQHDILTIPKCCWHTLINNTNDYLNIVEIQYGDKCIEKDIERNNDK